MGLIEGLYPGAAAQGLRDFPESTDVVAPRIGEVYTRGTLTLARLGREAPIAAASPRGPALRDRRRTAARRRAPSTRRAASRARRSCRARRSSAPNRPEQYERREDIGQPRKRFPAKQS